MYIKNKTNPLTQIAVFNEVSGDLIEIVYGPLKPNGAGFTYNYKCVPTKIKQDRATKELYILV